MTTPPHVDFVEGSTGDLKDHAGTVVVFADGDVMMPSAEAADAAAGGVIGRVMGHDDYSGSAKRPVSLAFPAGMACDRLLLASFEKDADRKQARACGGGIAGAVRPGPVTICTTGYTNDRRVAEMISGLVLRLYDFDIYKKPSDDPVPEIAITVLTDRPEALAAASRDFMALVEGIYFTRDLVNEPANTLTTDEFAARLAAMGEMGLDVEILGEPDLAELGCKALLAVGQGSESESKLVVMKWMGGGDEPPVALVGKGVVFDTGGISLKPAAGMEDMTMDMGGAGVVAGVMRSIAMRKAKANVIGVVGLVENMPDAKAQRPGDIIGSMKGDTIEVINTDAEGRLVLADALWYTQETYKPRWVVNLATLTGAIIVALSKGTAGHFANDDELEAAYAAACAATGDKSWRMPLDKDFHDQIKSTFADVKNTGGRNGGACTAAAFLEKFVHDKMPWIHIDIAGVTVAASGTPIAPKGATGWGVAALDELVGGRG